MSSIKSKVWQNKCGSWDVLTRHYGMGWARVAMFDLKQDAIDYCLEMERLC